eukprot:s3276_g9.t1
MRFWGRFECENGPVRVGVPNTPTPKLSIWTIKNGGGRRDGAPRAAGPGFQREGPRKLYQILPDRSERIPGPADLTSARARAALRSDVARQILAPKPASLGKSAAEGPNDRLQADLIDMSQNTRRANKFGLVVTDVFTREVATKALPDKRAETVTRAAAEIIPDLVEGEGDYVVTTDMGNEKKDLAGKVARDGGGWGQQVENVTEAYNARPHQAVTVAPEDVETMPAATFRVYQDNAQKFDKEPSAAARGGGGVPDPHQCSAELPAPVWSGAGGFELRLDDGASHGWLGDSAEACAPGSGEPVARLTRRPVPLAVRQLRDFNPGPTAPP